MCRVCGGVGDEFDDVEFEDLGAHADDLDHATEEDVFIDVGKAGGGFVVDECLKEALHIDEADFVDVSAVGLGDVGWACQCPCHVVGEGGTTPAQGGEAVVIGQGEEADEVVISVGIFLHVKEADAELASGGFRVVSGWQGIGGEADAEADFRVDKASGRLHVDVLFTAIGGVEGEVADGPWALGAVLELPGGAGRVDAAELVHALGGKLLKVGGVVFV